MENTFAAKILSNLTENYHGDLISIKIQHTTVGNKTLFIYSHAPLNVFNFTTMEKQVLRLKTFIIYNHTTQN